MRSTCSPTGGRYNPVVAVVFAKLSEQSIVDADTRWAHDRRDDEPVGPAVDVARSRQDHGLLGRDLATVILREGQIHRDVAKHVTL